MNAVLELFRTALHTAVAYAWWAKIEMSSRLGATKNARRPSNRKVLLLAWALPPMVNGGVYRPASFLKYGTSFGWSMSAISGPVTEDTGEAGRHLLETIPAEVRIHRLDRPALRPSWRFFPRVDGGFVNALATAQLAFRIFKDDPPAAVISSGPPFHNFAAAYYVARFFRAKLVLDYRDEWTECPFEFVDSGHVDQIWESRCLREAHAVVFTTPSQLKHQAGTFVFLNREKCAVIPNGWEPSNPAWNEEFEKTESDRAGRIVLSFVGNLAAHCRPDGFMVDIGRLLLRRPEFSKRIVVRFVGPADPKIWESLETYSNVVRMERVPPVSKLKVASFMRSSDALLIFADENLSRYIPGKLYEYIASGRPVLVHGHAGEASSLVGRLGAGTFIREGDVDGLEKWLDQLVKEPSRRSMDEAERNIWLQQHTREALARRFFDILEGL